MAQIDFRAAAWDAQAACDLAPAAPGPDDLEIWREGVNSGRLNLWAIYADNERIGALVWVAEVEHGGGRALVVQGMGARPCGVDLVAYADAVFAAMAKAQGGGALRFWTARPGLKRKTERMGYAPRYVMERAV